MEVERRILDRLLHWVDQCLPPRIELLTEDQQNTDLHVAGPVSHAMLMNRMFHRVLITNDVVRWGGCEDPVLHEQLDDFDRYFRGCMLRVETELLSHRSGDRWIENGLELLQDVQSWVNDARQSLI